MKMVSFVLDDYLRKGEGRRISCGITVAVAAGNGSYGRNYTISSIWTGRSSREEA